MAKILIIGESSLVTEEWMLWLQAHKHQVTIQSTFAEPKGISANDIPDLIIYAVAPTKHQSACFQDLDTIRALYPPDLPITLCSADKASLKNGSFAQTVDSLLSVCERIPSSKVKQWHSAASNKKGPVELGN